MAGEAPRATVLTAARWPLRRQLVAGAATQVVLLAALSGGAGLGPTGWSAGVAYAVGLCALLGGAARPAEVTTLGPAGLVTLVRAVLVGGATALVADALGAGPASTGVLVVLAAAALVLDGADGAVARRSGTASALGARFDMEVDALLILVLAVEVTGAVGAWALVIGLMRYAFVAAGWVLPWMRAELPARRSGKAVAALQGVVLVVAASGILPHAAAVGLVAVAAVVLTWSFGRDVGWLWRRRRTSPGQRESPGDDPPRDVLDTAARRGRIRTVGARVLTSLAFLLVLAALVAPNDLALVRPGAFARLPVEGLLGLGLLLVLRARPRRVVATLAGVLLGVLALLTALDLGFSAVLARPFDVVLDGILVEYAVEFLASSVGRTGAIGVTVGVAVGALAVVVLMALSVRRLIRLAVRHRTAAVRALAVLGAAWVICVVLGAQIVPGVPVAADRTASAVRDRAVAVRDGLQDERSFAAEAAVDPFRGVPGDQLLTALRGKDVVVAFVESYGRDALEDPELGPGVGAVLDDGNRRLAAAGYSARSAYLTSPVVGSGSWLAHATLLSGLWIDNQQRYRSLVSSDRLTLSSAFRRAGWEAAAVQPGTTRAWPEGAFYGFQRVHDVRGLGYRGPAFGWASMPDQFALAAFERLEHGREDRGPTMTEIDLVSSHAPWAPIPRLVGWDQLGDGSIFDAMTGPAASPEAIWTRNPTQVRTEYRQSVEYSLASLLSYVETYGDDDLVLVLLGDHQPAPIVTGAGASRDVPVTIVARDRAVPDRIAGWGWEDGLTPGPRAPVWRMDAFRDRFLSAFAR